MVKLSVCNRHHNTVGGLLAFLEETLTREGVPHERHLFGYLDRWDNLCSDTKPDQIHRPLYILNPLVPEHRFPWENKECVLRIENLDPHHLYKSIENPTVFEPVFHLELEREGEDKGPLERLLMEAVRYTQRWETQNSSVKDIVVYQWASDEFWDKLNTTEKRGLDTIYLPEKQLQEIVADLEWFHKESTKKLYSSFGIPYHRTYCLHGPPGTGKSSLILALVSHCQKNIGVFSLSRKTDDQSFIRALNTIPRDTVLLLEDIDCLLGERADKSSQITFSTLLNGLDGVQSKKGLVIFITTNYFVKLDPAFCRPGRIDYILEFSFVTQSQVFQMLHKFFKTQEHQFEQFYQTIRPWKITTCVLQKYLFERYPDKDILANMDQLRRDAEKFRFDRSQQDLYA